MKSNQALQRHVENSIKWQPMMHAAEIGVTAKDGFVSLIGVVDSYVKRIEAENAAKKVKGVTALVENIEVQFPSSWSKTDVEVANEVIDGLKHNWSVPNDKVTIKVEKGWVTLGGELQVPREKELKNAIIVDTGEIDINRTI